MSKIRASHTWSEAALAVFAQESRRIFRYEPGTRLGLDAEELHQMRVGTRRLRSALRLFEDALKLPRPTRRKQIGQLAMVLGSVRDLDVQTEFLKDHYLPLLPPEEQERLSVLLDYLGAERERKRSVMTTYLDSADYTAFHTACEGFLANPKVRNSSPEPLYMLLPELLRDQFATLWNHPGWAEPDAQTLHDLRIAVKRVRYCLEFFLDCYGKGMRSFYQELKRLQEELGIIHDCDVLLSQMHPDVGVEETAWHQSFPRLGTLIRQERRAALRRFRRLRVRLTDERTRSAVAVWAGWPGSTDELELFEHQRRPLGALELERKYRIDTEHRVRIEERLQALRFRSTPAMQQTDHYLEVLSPHQYLRLRREEQEHQVHHKLCRKDFGPSGSRRSVEETVTLYVYEAFLARFHQLPVPVVSKAHTRWSGFFDEIPFTISFDRIEGIGPYSGDYLEIEVMIPDRQLLEIAEERLQQLSVQFVLASEQRVEQSNVSLLLGWIAGQQVTVAQLHAVLPPGGN